MSICVWKKYSIKINNSVLRKSIYSYTFNFDTFGENFDFDTFQNDTFESVWGDAHSISMLNGEKVDVLIGAFGSKLFFKNRWQLLLLRKHWL